MVLSVQAVCIVPENLKLHDAAVIGGGPAGCAAAILLAGAGREVLLLEKTRTAHDKVCGEFLSWEAVHYLEMLGVDLAGAGAQPIRRLRLFDGATTLETDLPFTAWSLSRRRLDEILIEKAGRAGVMIRRGAGVNSLGRLEHGWQLLTAQGHGWRAHTVLLASGKHNVRGWPRLQRRPLRDFIGFKMHLRLAPAALDLLRGVVEVFLFDEGYAGLELVEDGKANLCLLISRDVYAGPCARQWPALLAWLGGCSSYLKSRLAGAVSLWRNPLAVYGTPYGYHFRPLSPQPDLFRLGDQLAVIPSFAGDGIAIALHTAFLAAQSFLAGTGADAYHQSTRRALQAPLGRAGLVADLALNANGRRLALLMSRLMPGLLRLTIQVMRIDGGHLLAMPPASARPRSINLQ
jgi:flavin-dependent dehydrogenase